MARKNKNKGGNASPSVTSASAQSAEEIELQNINARAAELQKQILERAEKAKQDRIALFNGFVTQAGAKDFTELVAMIKRIAKGDKSARGRTIDEVTKAAIDADVKASNGTAEEIATRHGVSSPYVQGRRKALGMVKTRKVKA